MVVNQYDIFWIDLNPTIGSEINKIRPCLVISPNEMNSLRTVLVAPMTTKGLNLPTRIKLTFKGKKGQVVLDQIRAVDKSRVAGMIGKLSNTDQRSARKVTRGRFAVQNARMRWTTQNAAAEPMA